MYVKLRLVKLRGRQPSIRFVSATRAYTLLSLCRSPQISPACPTEDAPMADISPQKIFRPPFSPTSAKQPRPSLRVLHQAGLIVGIFFKKILYARFCAVGMTVIPTTDARAEPVTVRGDSITTFFRRANWGIPSNAYYFDRHYRKERHSACEIFHTFHNIRYITHVR